MRLLLVGANSKYAIELPYLKYLRELPEFEQVELFEAQNMFLEYYQKSVINKILYRLGYNQILRKINNKLLDKVANYKPDIILVFKGMELFPKTLNQFRKKGILIANYNPDNPFIFSGKGSGNKNITHSIGLYDIHFTYNLSIQAQLEKTTKAKVFFLPFGFDINEEQIKQVSQQEEILKACFLGNPDIYRAEFITKLAQQGIEIDVYGNNWSKFVNHGNIKIYNPVHSDEFWITLYKYRVQLNLMRPHNEKSHNMRSFEVPGVGGIGLFPETQEHSSFFERDKEVFLYADLNECIKKINYILALGIEEASNIRNAARAKSLAAGYSYKSRARYVYDIITHELKSKL